MHHDCLQMNGLIMSRVLVLTPQKIELTITELIALFIAVFFLILIIFYLIYIQQKLRASHREAEYLSAHDELTGLYNRTYLNEVQKQLDVFKNLPISVIVGDVNGLKLTNDVFGHASGDLLLQKTAETLRSVCRSDDIIARVGGDEFMILLPRTNYGHVEQIANRIRKALLQQQIMAVRGSISLGYATKEKEDQLLESVIEQAEEMMYFDKSIQRKDESLQKIRMLVHSLHETHPKEQAHAERVSYLSESLARALDLPESSVQNAKVAGYLHDIGKIVHSDIIAKPYRQLTRQEQAIYRQHPLVGFRILNAFEKTVDLADAVLAHHEAFDGTGYPKGLKGHQIPLIAKIISIAEVYDTNTNGYRKPAISPEEALLKIQSQAGKRFDPDIAAAFSALMTTQLKQKEENEAGGSPCCKEYDII